MKRLLIIVFFLPHTGIAQLSIRQEAQIDSIKAVIGKAGHDSIKIEAFRHWDDIIYVSDPAMDWVLNKRIDSICDRNLKKNLSAVEKKFFLIKKADAINIFGVIYFGKGEYEKAIVCYEQSLDIMKKLKNKKGIAASINNIGESYRVKGDFRNAILYYNRSLRIQKEIGNKSGMASSLGNIALIYKDQQDFPMATEYTMKSLKIRKAMKDAKGIATCYNDLGNINEDRGTIELEKGHVQKADSLFEVALGFHFESLKIANELGNKSMIGNSLNNIGLIYDARKEFDKAKDYYFKSLKYYEETNDRIGIALSCNNIGNALYDLRDFRGALVYGKRAYETAEEAGSIIYARDAAQALWRLYKTLGDSGNSLAMYEIYIKLKDSILSDENTRAVIQEEYKHQYEIKTTKDSIRDVEEKKVNDARIAQRDAEIKAKNNQQVMLYGGLGLLLVFAGFMYNRFRVTSMQKAIIEEQKHMVEEKNKEITDSINYAKRIQTAILPPHKAVAELLPDSFILYKPKDIVAGDFYWMESFAIASDPEGKEKKDKGVLLAACDCTGHGVPGAMVSVVCNNGLNRSVREFGLTDPGKILDKTRELVIQEFEKSEEEVKDGMDISLVSLEISMGEIIKLKWAGANNPLWIIRKDRKQTTGEGGKPGMGEYSVIEIKPDKQPIGKYADSKPFATHQVEIRKGDAIYIFTDGFQDQFGGEKGKKLKASKFKELLLSVQDKEMTEQKSILNGTFEEWKGNLEQNDDVCVIGIKIQS